MLKVGLLINPVAGTGGRHALKGSDDAALVALARAAGARGRGADRASRLLRALGDKAGMIRWLCWGDGMGADVLEAAGLPFALLGEPASETTAADTRQAAQVLRDAGAELLLFCGGDGTARELLTAIGQSIPVLGIPSGVKMHSGVFATTPEAAAAVLAALLEGGLVRSIEADVRDMDESALRSGQLRPAFYGELRVPEQGGFLQHTKESGRENEALAVAEIVAELEERIGETGGIVVLGPGSTLAAIKTALGMTPTLLGIDVWEDGRQIGTDVTAEWLEARLGLDRLGIDRSGTEQRSTGRPEAPPAAHLVVSFTRQQGFLLGRGNLQLSPAVLRAIGREHLWVVGTRTKLLSLGGRPLLIDTDDPELDRDWTGLVEVIAGYDDRLWYRLDSGLLDG